MDWGYLLDLIYEAAYFLGAFTLFMFFAIIKGRQAIINTIFGLYLALLITLEWPGYSDLFAGDSGSQSLLQLLLFIVITGATTFMCYRVMPDEFQENKFESVGKKALLAFCATVLVMIFSFHVLPVTDFLTPGTPIQSLFAPEGFFFYWLLLPMVVLVFI